MIDWFLFSNILSNGSTIMMIIIIISPFLRSRFFVHVNTAQKFLLINFFLLLLKR